MKNIATPEILNITGDLTFATVKQQHQIISKFIADSQGHSAVINLADVQHSDSAGLALLIEILKIATRLQKKVSFTHLTSQIQSMIQFCNLSAIVNG